MTSKSPHIAQVTEQILLTTVVVLSLFGIIMLWSAGVIYAQTRFDSQYYLIARQLVGLGLGFGALLILRKIDYHIWQRLALPIFIVGLGLVVALFIPGVGMEIYGATRWINLGFVTFQPSEALKLALIVYLAAWFAARKPAQIRDLYETLVPFTAIMALIGFLIVNQPDVGTLGLMSLIAVVIYFVAGAPLRHLALLLGAAVSALYLLILAAPYRMGRLLVFLDPTKDPQGIGYQIAQALMAVGSGQIFGRGLGYSMQKFNYLPEAIGDSIFAVIAEELGFVGSVGLLMVYGVIAFYGLRVARYAPDTFGRLLATGIVAWIILQAIINIGAITGMMPLTGVPLPFISYGSTSLFIMLASVGILLNIARQMRPRV